MTIIENYSSLIAGYVREQCYIMSQTYDENDCMMKKGPDDPQTVESLALWIVTTHPDLTAEDHVGMIEDRLHAGMEEHYRPYSERQYLQPKLTLSHGRT